VKSTQIHSLVRPEAGRVRGFLCREPSVTARTAPTAGIVAAFAGIYIVWGTTYLAIAIAIQTLPPFISGSMRFLLGGILLYAWLQLRQPRPFAHLPLRNTIACGVLMTGIGNGFVVWAQQGVPSGIAALVIAATPVAVMLLDWIAFDRHTPRVRAMLGIGLAFAGVAIIIVHGQTLAGDIQLPYLVALLGAVAGWSFGTLLQKRLIRADYVLAFTCVQMFAGAAFQGVLSLLNDEWARFDVHAVSAASLFAVLYLVVFGSIVASNCYLWLLAHVSPHKVTTYAVVNPVVALILGAVVLGEEVSMLTAFAAVLVLLGIALVLFQDLKVRPRTAAPPLATPSGVEPERTTT
jgi:drug/metabolite transporter (DMT)-like permease